MTEPKRLPYKPFPSFRVWAGHIFDTDTFDRFRDLLNSTKGDVDESALANAVRVATKQAAVDTGAIENLYSVERGFTFTVAAQAVAWDNMHHEIGTEAARAIGDALDAYDFVLDLATGKRHISEQWIRQLHEILCRSQETYQVITEAGRQDHTLPKGEYKTEPNSPFNFDSGEIHSYASPLDTSPEMARLVSELSSAEFANAHPIIQASYAHYAFVCVHPFADGNGRVSRALASIYLYRSPGVPLVVFADEKSIYLDALESADRGDYPAFIGFVSDRVIDTIQMVRTTMRRGSTELSDRLGNLPEILTGRGGLAHEEIDAIGDRLSDAFASAIAAAVTEVQLPQLFDVGLLKVGQRQSNVPKGFRGAPSGKGTQLTVHTSGVGHASTTAIYGVAIGKGGNTTDDFALVRHDGTVVETVLLREVHPAITSALRYRMNVAAEAELVDIAERTAHQTRVNLENKGYR